MGLKMDFKTGRDENRGIYYSETNRAVIYLAMHETIEDIYKTCTHETIHYCLDELDESDNMDEEMEEKLIFSMAWATEAIP